MFSSLKRRSVAFGAALGLALGAPALAADTLLVNGRIFTANPAAPNAEAVAVRDGTILAVGSRADVEKALAPGYATEDLGDKMLLPGLIDSHVHAVFAGFTLVAAELPQGDASVERLAEFATASMKSGRGMIGDTLRIGNLTASYWDNVAALDKVFNAPPFADIPVILAGSDAHTGWANKVLLKRAGVTRDYIAGLSEAERKYFGHGQDFTPNGFSADTGWDKVMGAVPPVSQQTMIEAARSAVKVMNSNGVTAWLDPISNGRPAAPLFDMVPTKVSIGLEWGPWIGAQKGPL
ncbi:amidohydrolase family protein [Mesorhizobium sp. 1M-11]|uniref:amidohydrolase family protein n=1 Tax=Mesorhizobium sp. 1M-11 TaxID=1529006 RepID=UPI0006C751CF|nr:amidohydrolase family protein [Mesorhizobium sp. 1M-11]